MVSEPKLSFYVELCTYHMSSWDCGHAMLQICRTYLCVDMPHEYIHTWWSFVCELVGCLIVHCPRSTEPLALRHQAENRGPCQQVDGAGVMAGLCDIMDEGGLPVRVGMGAGMS